MRRQATVAVAVVVAIGAAAGIAVAVNQANKPYRSAAAKNTAGQAGQHRGRRRHHGRRGDKNNKNTVQEYEDLRCPICAAYEQAAGDAVLQGAKDGKYKIDYTFATFLDDKEGGAGSKKALSALGAALNVSTDAFEQYHTLLYSKAVHPDETKDEFNDAAKLISLAQKVPGAQGQREVLRRGEERHLRQVGADDVREVRQVPVEHRPERHPDRGGQRQAESQCRGPPSGERGLRDRRPTQEVAAQEGAAQEGAAAAR